MAAALLLAETRQRGIDDVVIASAGFGVAGMSVADAAVSVAEARDIDLSRKRSRTLDVGMVGPADIVLAVHPDTRAMAVDAVPSAMPKTFVLGRLVAAATARPDGQRADAWVTSVAEAVQRSADGGALAEPDPADFGAVLDHADALFVQIQAFVDLAWVGSQG